MSPKLYVSEAINAGGKGGSNLDGVGGDAERIGHIFV
jgi:hypothetical protein